TPEDEQPGWFGLVRMGFKDASRTASSIGHRPNHHAGAHQCYACLQPVFDHHNDSQKIHKMSLVGGIRLMGAYGEKGCVVTGLFVVFEGADGTGKSTQVAAVADALRHSGKEVVVTREPGGSDVAETL